MAKLKAFLQTEQGATAIEYALIAGIITVGMLAVWSGIASKLSAEFSEMSSALK